MNIGRCAFFALLACQLSPRFVASTVQSSSQFPSIVNKPHFLSHSHLSTVSMSATPTTFEAFLREAKAAVSASKEPVPKNLYYVIGNEAADTDSIIGALTLAFGLQRGHLPLAQAIVKAVATPDTSTVSFVPIVSCTSEDFGLRQDTVSVLTSEGVQEEDLIFVDQVDWKAVGKATTPIVLVDHNAIDIVPRLFDSEGSKTAADANVVAIVDHHTDMQTHAKTLISGCSDVRLVGSCCTLIADHFMQHDAAGFETYTSLQSMLGKVILLDTSNLDSESKKFDPLDTKLLTQFMPSETDRKTQFTELLRLRNDVVGLTSAQRLRKDYKQYTAAAGKCTYGMSSVPMPLDLWAEEKTLPAAVAAFLKEREIDFLIIMAAFEDKDGTFRRQAVIAGLLENSSVMSSIEWLASNEKLEFRELTSMSWGDADTLRLASYEQLALSMSRKHLQPLLHTWLDTPKRQRTDSDELGRDGDRKTRSRTTQDS